MANRVLECATLAKPQYRLTLWAAATVAIFLVPRHWLENLSLWKRIGWESAPSIGLTRAYRDVLHGDIQSAVEMNWIIFLILLIGLPLLAFDAVKVIHDARNKKRSL